MRVALVGATGLVGQVMIQVLEERNFPLSELIPVASASSIGKEVHFKGQQVKVVGIETAIEAKPDIALFSAGGETSMAFAEKFAAVGTTVIDNSSAWRMDPNKKLIIPEVNAHELTKEDKIIANPNCSTIQMILALAPIHKKYGIERIVVSTYQSITGTGVKAVRQLEDEQNSIEGEKAYPHQIHRNALPHCDVFQENGYTKEEMKLVKESQKIMGEPDLKVTATAVRIPTMGGHSESVNLSLKKEFELEEIKSLLSQSPGVVVQDDVAHNLYPMPITSHGKDEVFVGRIRRDESQENGLNLWIVADNLRKGAATNAVQIAEYLVESKLVQTKT
ncbi:MAG: aspartate-semialdehyde dehydrogenase [Vicingaceae bacterium]